MSGGYEKRLEQRVPMDMFLNEYVRERPYRALVVNLSEGGLYLQKLAEPITRHSRIVGLEFELPGTGEIVWAKAEARFDSLDEDFHLSGVRFVAMADKHRRLVRDFVYDKHKRSGASLLQRFRMTQLMTPQMKPS